MVISSRQFHFVRFRENGAMIEVFYEQLNFELLTESEAYEFVSAN